MVPYLSMKAPTGSISRSRSTCDTANSRRSRSICSGQDLCCGLGSPPFSGPLKGRSDAEDEVVDVASKGSSLVELPDTSVCPETCRSEKRVDVGSWVSRGCEKRAAVGSLVGW